MAALVCRECGKNLPDSKLVAIPHKDIEDAIHKRELAISEAAAYKQLLVEKGIDPNLAKPKGPEVISSASLPPIEPPPGGWGTVADVVKRLGGERAAAKEAVAAVVQKRRDEAVAYGVPPEKAAEMFPLSTDPPRKRPLFGA